MFCCLLHTTETFTYSLRPCCLLHCYLSKDPVTLYRLYQSKAGFNFKVSAKYKTSKHPQSFAGIHLQSTRTPLPPQTYAPARPCALKTLHSPPPKPPPPPPSRSLSPTSTVGSMAWLSAWSTLHCAVKVVIDIDIDTGRPGLTLCGCRDVQIKELT